MINKKQHKALKLQESGKLREAEELFKQILKTKPMDFLSLFSLGVILLKNGNPLTALEYIDKSIKVKPGFALAWYNRGFVLQTMKWNHEALESYDRALTIDPNDPGPLMNRGLILRELGQRLKALENYERLLQFEPDNPAALSNMGIIYTELKQYSDAILVLQKLLRSNPEFDYASGFLCNALQIICQWDQIDTCVKMISEGIAVGKRVCDARELLTMSDSPHKLLLGARIFGRHLFPPQATLWRGERYDHAKIRIAYISPDLQEHPVTHLMAGIFEGHDKTQFETVAISLGIDDNSPLRNRIVASFDTFIEARHKSSKEIAGIIRSLEIDIAIDLAGYTAGSRLDIFAQRPAPVQVNYLGYPGTLGVEYMDYILADRWVIPESDCEHFTENVVYLPDSYLPADDTLTIADRTPTREECGLPAEGFIFCSFNHSYKITPKIFDIWMQILTATPGSVLWLMKLNSSAEANLQREAGARGVDSRRLIFATRVPDIRDHLARYRLADLFLDTTPYNAHTTASDALFVGLPVLTCQGSAFPGRVAGSLLHAIGMPELIAGSLQEYQDLAIRLAQDHSLLDGLRQKLLNNHSTYPLFDTKKQCRSIEAAFIAMWERQQGGKRPASFSVPGQSVPIEVPIMHPETIVAPDNESGITTEQKRNQALAFQQNGELGKAEAAFRQILIDNPNDVISLYSLGVITLNMGDPETSLKYFDRAAGLVPMFAPTWFNRGMVLQTLGRNEAALASFNRALEIDASHVQAQAARDALAASLGRNSETAHALEIKKLEDMRREALPLRHDDQFAEAWGLFNQILATYPLEFVSLCTKAIVAFQTIDSSGNPACNHKAVTVSAPLIESDLTLISVIIPCYNQARFLQEAVESVIAQSYTNNEIIIVNDGSTDDTSLIANKLIAEYSYHSIRLLEKTNGGLASARNHGIRAKGAFILPLDADDKIHPDMLRKCHDLLKDNPELSIAYTDYQHFGDAHHVVTTPEYDFQFLYTQQCLHTATALYRKSAWIDTGGYNQNMIWGTEDWDFWINCGKHGHVGKRVPEVLFYYRAKLSDDSMLRRCKKYTNELFARMFLNHRELYDASRIAWAKKVWAEALVVMLGHISNDSKEYSYLRNLDVIELIAEATILITTGKTSTAHDLYRFWLKESQFTDAFAKQHNGLLTQYL